MSGKLESSKFLSGSYWCGPVSTEFGGAIYPIPGRNCHFGYIDFTLRTRHSHAAFTFCMFDEDLLLLVSVPWRVDDPSTYARSVVAVAQRNGKRDFSAHESTHRSLQALGRPYVGLLEFIDWEKELAEHCFGDIMRQIPPRQRDLRAVPPLERIARFPKGLFRDLVQQNVGDIEQFRGMSLPRLQISAARR